MKAKISNFGRISGEYEIEIQGLTALVGYNEAGKSSTLEAIGRAASSSKLSKEKAKGYVNREAASASVSIETESGEMTYTLPDNEIQGGGLKVSATAAGLVNLCDVAKEAERFRLLGEALQLEPTFKELETELAKTELFDEQEIKAAWSAICPPASGKADWESAHKVYKDNRTKLTARWCEVTGSRQWGSEKGDLYAPDGYDRDKLLGLTLAQVETGLTVAEKREKELIANVAISGAKRAALTAQVEKIPELQAKIREAEEALAELPEGGAGATSGNPIQCCECGADLVVVGSKTILKETFDADAEASKKASEAAAKRVELQAKLSRYQAYLKDAMSAKNELEDAASGSNESEVQAAQQITEGARKVKDAFLKFTRANDLNKEIRKCVELVKVTAPDGLKGQKLRKALAKFNTYLEQLSEIAEWKTVKVESDGSVSAGGFYFEQLSASAKLRARAIIQAAFAAYDKSELVIVDAVDLLDNQDGGRRDLLNMLAALDRPVLIGCTADSIDDLAAIETSGAGLVYQVKDGAISRASLAVEAG